MKRFIAISISVIFLVLALASCGKDTDVPKGMKICEENDFYTMFVPESWEVIETNSDFGLAQATSKTIVGTTGDLSNVTVNSVYYLISDKGVEGETNEERNNRLFDDYFNKLKSQLTGEFDQVGDGSDANTNNGLFKEFSASEPRDFTLGESSAREYVYTAKYGDLYYKYYTNVIIHEQNYYVITFNFPQNVRQEGGEIVKDTSIEDVSFNDSQYKEDMQSIVDNFIPKK